MAIDDFDEIGVGLRVLAVDDDPTCLAVLEGLLKKCKYIVTATNQATTALKLLREDKSKFDIMISDVSMPDMDGFKLLKLVGVEMDLPVVMLSQYGDKEFVYKGVMHGAVDYLIKPVRLDIVQNIWQHVVRRRNLSQKSVNGQGTSSSASTEQLKSGGRKRRDREDDWKEACEENANEDDDSGAPKKPRVVWSVDLHRKFVAAVDYLGYEKAVPKKILDLMSVEGLTRENVASHLQKYRSYLKRVNAAQEGHLMSAIFGGDSSFSLKRMPIRGLVNPGLVPSYPQGLGIQKFGAFEPTYATNAHLTTSSSDFGESTNVEGFFGGQNAFAQSGYGSLDDIVNAMMKNGTRQDKVERGGCAFGNN